MSEALYLGFDLGTTFFKVGLYNEGGECRGLGHRPFVKDEEPAGRCTVPAERFKETVAGAFHDALAEAGRTPKAVRGVSYCSQANTFLLLDRHDRPLTPLIVWPDLRAEPFSKELDELTKTDAFLEVSGQGIRGAQGMPAKLEWLRCREPGVWSQAARLLTISDYLSLLLTGLHIGDSGTASLTGLWALQRNRWNPAMLDFLELDARALPELYRPGALTVGIGRRGAAWLGIPEGTPFTIGALDHHAAALGGGIGHWAPVSVSFGTSLVCFRFEDGFKPARGSCVGPATDPERFYRIAFNAPGASAMDWYQRDYAPETAFEELLASAEGIPSGCEGLRAVSGNGAIRFQGKRPLHGRGHFVRAVMEFTGRNTATLLRDLAAAEGSATARILAVGGAAKSDLWMRAVEEAAGVGVSPARPADTAAKGAAMFAAVQAGLCGSLEACAMRWCKVGESNL